MLKKISIRKITLTSAALFACLLIYLVPSVSEEETYPEDLEYVDNDATYSPVFLLDKNSYVAQASVTTSGESVEEKARELLNVLIIGQSENVPNGFSPIIPPNTEILSLTYENGLIKVDFSDDILEIDEKLEEKMKLKKLSSEDRQAFFTHINKHFGKSKLLFNADGVEFYEIEATKSAWSLRTLQRQYNSSLCSRRVKNASPTMKRISM